MQHMTDHMPHMTIGKQPQAAADTVKAIILASSSSTAITRKALQPAWA